MPFPCPFRDLSMTLPCPSSGTAPTCRRTPTTSAARYTISPAAHVSWDLTEHTTCPLHANVPHRAHDLPTPCECASPSTRPAHCMRMCSACPPPCQVHLLAWNLTEYDRIILSDLDPCFAEDPPPWLRSHAAPPLASPSPSPLLATRPRGSAGTPPHPLHASSPFVAFNKVHSQ